MKENLLFTFQETMAVSQVLDGVLDTDVLSICGTPRQAYNGHNGTIF